MPILETRDLSFAYADGTLALQALSLGFARGRRSAVLGHNGAGKTTLFSLLNGLERPQQGEVRFAGQPLDYRREPLRSLRRQIGVVFQDPDSQLFSASIREDVSFGPLNLGLDRAEVIDRVEQALAAVGLSTLADRPTHALSYGEKKRACIAGVLAMHPQVLILDEPTAGLDRPATAGLLQLLDELHDQGITLIVATHDVDFAYAWADELCVLENGRAVLQCTAGDTANVATRFPELGLELPWVLDVYRQLKPDDTSLPPRNRSELLARLK